jgi:hypothetical protein
MSALGELQLVFWQCVRHRPSPTAVDVANLFVGDDRLDAEERIEIYRKAYWYRQIDALADLFPKLYAILGAQRFAEMASAYLAEHPSRSGILERVGAELSSFLARQGPFHSSLSPLAAFEHLRIESLLSEDSPVLKQSEVDVDSFGPSCLRFSRSLRRISLPRRSLAQWEGGADGERPDDAVVVEVAVSRRGFTIFHVELEADEAAALDLARSGASVDDCLEAFAGHKSPESRAAEVLVEWFRREWLSTIEGVLR